LQVFVRNFWQTVETDRVSIGRMLGMRELSPEVSREMALAIENDNNLMASTRNEKWALAYNMLFLLEKMANQGGGVGRVSPEALANMCAKYFNGANMRLKKANALTAINRARRLYDAYKSANPYETCNFETFLSRYGLRGNEPVPFSKGIQIITAQEESYHLKRAREKFDKLIAKLAEAPRPQIDPDAIEIKRRLPYAQDIENPLSHGTFYDCLKPTDYPKVTDEIPDDLFFRARDVWELWKKASELKISKRHRKFF
jgi:hypothetical protein